MNDLKMIGYINYLKTVLAVLALLSLMACQNPSQSANGLVAEPNSEAELFVFGDNLAAGYGSNYSFAEVLAATKGLEVVDKTFSGANAVVNNTLNLSWLSDVDQNDTVILCVGYQDVRWYGVSYPYVDNYNNHISPFLLALKATGARVYIVGPIKMKASSYGLFAPSNNGSNQAMIDFNTNLSSSVAALNDSDFTFVDIMSFVPQASNLTPDEQFPNELGHDEITSIILNQIGSL
ncbi:SGNH/GDSL hydrolase family protein [Candidatus Dependentiae bacterium]|nr:MAG: SGNH/GDSL hydrolase family protein [Candidatus Dependentiae bacterium]